jgi:uncharacterized protein
MIFGLAIFTALYFRKGPHSIVLMTLINPAAAPSHPTRTYCFLTFDPMKPLLIFFILAYFISWVVWLPLYAPAWGWDNLPILPYHHALGGLGPMIAAVITIGVFSGKEGVRDLAHRCLQFRPIGYLLIALFSPFLLLGMAIVLNGMMGGTAGDLSTLFYLKEFPEFNLLSFFLYNLVFFGFGEEVGWRGFALPRLQRRFNLLVSSIVLTLFWAIWHWPLFLYRPGYVSMGMAGIFGWGVSLLTGSILLSWLYHSSRGSILICAIFHATVDIVFLANAGDNMITQYLGALITVWGIVVGIGLWRSGKRVSLQPPKSSAETSAKL